MAKKPNGAAKPKAPGPPDGALPLDETTIQVVEHLTADEREAQAKLADAEHELLVAARKRSAGLKAELKKSRDDERAHGQRYERISHEATSGRRKVDVVVRPYVYGGKKHFFDPATWLEVGEPVDATDADRQGALYAGRRGGGEESEGAS